MLKKEEIETILKENPNYDLIWVASSEKNRKSLVYRLKMQTKALEQSLFSKDEEKKRLGTEKYEYYGKKVNSIRGVVLIGIADNRLSNKQQRESAEFVVEKNVSSETFDKFCNKELSEKFWGRIYC